MKRSEAALRKAKQSANKTMKSARVTVDYTAKAARAGVEEVGKELQIRRDHVRDSALALREALEGTAGRVAGSVRGRWVATRDGVVSATRSCKGYVTENPKASVAGALGLGALVGLLVGHSRVAGRA